MAKAGDTREDLISCLGHCSERASWAFHVGPTLPPTARPEGAGPANRKLGWPAALSVPPATVPPAVTRRVNRPARGPAGVTRGWRPSCPHRAGPLLAYHGVLAPHVGAHSGTVPRAPVQGAGWPGRPPVRLPLGSSRERFAHWQATLVDVGSTIYPFSECSPGG